MKTFIVNGGEEFILHKFWTFCEKKSILIKYAASHVYQQNKLAEQGWRTIITMKDSMLINNGLPNRFWAEAMETVNNLRNKLPTKSKYHDEIIPKEA